MLIDVHAHIGRVLKDRKLFHFILRKAWLAQKPLAAGGQLMRHLPFFFSKDHDFRSLPVVARTPLRDMWDQINPRLEFINECAVNLCLMSEEDYLRLSRVVRKLNLVCAEPNLDVLPGFSAQWCFALRDVPALRVDNVFDFPDADSLRRELMRRALQFAATTAAGCQHAKCKTILCRGPCPAYAHWAAVSASR